MAKEPDHQNGVDNTKKIGYDTTKGWQETTVEEQELFEMLIKSQLENLNAEEQPEPDLNVESQGTQIDISDIERLESIEEEPDIDENLEINVDIDTPMLDMLENNVKLDLIFRMAKSIKNELQNKLIDDNYKKRLKFFNKITLSMIYLKYQDIVNFKEDVEIYDKILDDFSDKKTINELVENLEIFHSVFTEKLKKAFERQQKDYWISLKEVLDFKFNTEEQNITPEKQKEHDRYVKNVRTAAMRTNAQILFYLNNFTVKFIHVLELAYIYGIQIINIDNLYNLSHLQKHLVFAEKCSYLFPEYNETRIKKCDRVVTESYQGLKGLNLILNMILNDEQEKLDERMDEKMDEEYDVVDLRVNNMSLLDKLADAVLFKMGAMKGLTKYTELTTKYDIIQQKMDFFRKDRDELLYGYYEIIDLISGLIKGSTIEKFLRKGNTRQIQVGGEKKEVTFFHSAVQGEPDPTYNQHLIRIIKEFVEIFRNNYSKKKV